MRFPWILLCYRLTYAAQQLRRPSVPRIRHLRDVTIRYTNVDERPDVDYLCRYIRQVVAYSALERLRLVCENEVQGASPAFNPLVEHLYLKHATTLRALHMPDCFVSFDAIVKLCRKCKSLEELSVAISADMLVSADSSRCGDSERVIGS